MLVARKLRVAEANSPVALANHVARSLLAVCRVKESRTGVHERMTPPVEDDPGNVTLGIKAMRREQLSQVAPKPALVVSVVRSQHLHSPCDALLPRVEPRIQERQVKMQRRRLVGMQRRVIASRDHRLTDVAGEAYPIEPP